MGIPTRVLLIFLSAPIGLSQVHAASGAAAVAHTEVVVREKPPAPALSYFEEVEIEYRVKLSTKMRAAVINAYPGFTPWEQSDYLPRHIRSYDFSRYSTPSVVAGDFNGDGKVDAALVGHNAHGVVVLAVLSSSDSTYKVIPVVEDTEFDFFLEKQQPIPADALAMLLFQPKGKKYRLGDMYIKELALQNDGFVVRSMNVYRMDRFSNSSLYWWDNDKGIFLSSGLGF